MKPIVLFSNLKYQFTMVKPVSVPAQEGSAHEARVYLSNQPLPSWALGILN